MVDDTNSNISPSLPSGKVNRLKDDTPLLPSAEAYGHSLLTFLTKKVRGVLNG